MQSTDKRVVLALLFILLLGSALRLYGLSRESLDNDELSHMYRSNPKNFPDLSAVVGRVACCVIHPPGHQILLHLVQKYVGDSETILRLPSAISGILSILVIYLIGARLYSHKEGLYAAALLAVLWAPIHYSQTVRPMAPLLLSTLAASYFWINVIMRLKAADRPSACVVAGYILSSIVSAYLHYFGLYFIMLQFVGAVLFVILFRRAAPYVLLLYLPVALAYLPWLYGVVDDLWEDVTWITPPDYTSFFRYLEFAFNRSQALGLIALASYVLFFVRGAYDILNTRSYKNIRGLLFSPGPLLLVWLIVPFAGACLISVLWHPVLAYESLIISFPAAYLLIARAFTRLPLASGKRAAAVFLVVAFLFYHLVFSMEYFSKPHKEQFREAVYFIAENDRIYGDSLIVWYAWNSEYFDYYFKRAGSPMRVEVFGGTEADIQRVSDRINRKKPKHIWFIRAHNVPDKGFLDFLGENRTLITHERFIKADVRLFRG